MYVVHVFVLKAQCPKFEIVSEILISALNLLPPAPVKNSPKLQIRQQFDFFEQSFKKLQNSLRKPSDPSIITMKEECQRVSDNLAALQFQLMSLRRCERTLFKDSGDGESGLVKIALLTRALYKRLASIASELGDKTNGNSEKMLSRLAEELQSHHQEVSDKLDALLDGE